MYSNMKNQKVAKKFILKNKKWSYRGEGNANLVLALVKERKILRLKKSIRNEKAKAEEDRVWRELEFCKRIMLPLLGARFVPVPTVVRLQPQELTELNDSLTTLRPLHRHNKGLYAKYAALFTDLCLLPDSFASYWAPTYCVEVKPKQGWIPFPDRRLQKCTFCLNQYSKFKQGTIKEISQYCPLDLFSGNVARMKRAIVAMLKSPQNNLKMFKNGTLVYGDTVREQYEVVLRDWFGCYDIDILVDNFTKIVLGALTNDFSEADCQNVYDEPSYDAYNVEGETPGKSLCSSRIPKYLLDEAQSLLSGSTCYGDSEALPKNCILSRILQVQKLDVLGSDAIYQLYSNLLYKEDYAYVYDLFRSFHNIYKPINSYLLATTAKDCSVLISFKKMPVSLINYECSIKDLNNVNYALNVGVSDLDPKPMSCIEKHRKRDYEAIINCLDILRSGK